MWSTKKNKGLGKSTSEWEVYIYMFILYPHAGRCTFHKSIIECRSKDGTCKKRGCISTREDLKRKCQEAKGYIHYYVKAMK